jgi:AsmA protein
MGKLLKISALILASIFLLVIIAITFMAITLDPNNFKPQIQSLIQKNLGRKLSIEGDIELSIFPWIGFSTGKLSLSNIEAFSEKPFAKIEKSNIKIKLLPLLSNKIEVNQIRLKGLALNLTKNKLGLNNWDDLIHTKNTKTELDIPIESLAINGVSIEQAKIIWDDQQQGHTIEINNFDFNTGKLAFNHPIAIDSSLTIVNKEPAITESIDVSSTLVINETLDTLKLTTMTIESLTQANEILNKPLRLTILADVALDLSKQTLDISTLDINFKNLLISAIIRTTKITSKPLVKGSIKIPAFDLAQLLKNMAISLPAMQDPKALSSLSATFNIQASTDLADIQDLTIKLDDSTINGSGCIKNYSNPVSHFNLWIDSIDADRYLPGNKQTVSKPNKHGSTKAINSIPESAMAESAALLPLDMLQKLNINGLLVIDKLFIRDLNMQNLSLKLNAKDNVIKTQCE